MTLLLKGILRLIQRYYFLKSFSYSVFILTFLSTDQHFQTAVLFPSITALH